MIHYLLATSENDVIAQMRTFKSAIHKTYFFDTYNDAKETLKRLRESYRSEYDKHGVYSIEIRDFHSGT